MARKYNYIYKSLVEDKSDIYGHFAYNAYKSDKIRFIEEFKIDHGKAPTETELEAFHQKSQSRIGDYKAIGKEVADKMIKNLINNQIVKIQTDCIEKIEGSVNSAFAAQPKPSKNRIFWGNVGASFVGALIVALLPLLLAFMCYLFHPDATKRYLQDISPFKQTQDEQTISSDSSQKQ
jgi:hypothetical protein